MAKMPQPSKPTAATPPPPDINEQVRGGLKSFLRSLVIIIPLIALGWVAYMLVWGSNPRNQLATVDAFVNAYNGTASLYVGPNGGLPDSAALDEYLSFFDSQSREFFYDNAAAMAKRRLAFDQPAYDALSKGGRHAQAMIYLVNRAPLSGFSPPTQARQADGERTEIVVRARDSRDHRLVLEKARGTWYLTNLGGLQEALAKELEPFQPKEK